MAKRWFSWITPVAMVLLVPMTLPAQAFESSPSNTGTPRIDRREREQQKRIRQGVKSGELTRKEARRLERKEGKIRADEMIAKSDGKVTAKERRRLNHDLHRASRDIHRQKHDRQRRPS